MNSTIRKAATLGAGALAVAGLTLGGALSASAHTPTLVTNCTQVALQLTGYPAGSSTTAIVDGSTAWSQTFGPEGFQDSVNFAPNTRHTWTVSVVSSDGPRYSFTESGSTPESCITPPPVHEEPPVVVPPVEPPVVEEPPVVVTPPVEPPVVEPPVVVTPPVEPPVVVPPVTEPPVVEPPVTEPPVVVEPPVVTPELPEETPITEPETPAQEPVVETPAPITVIEAAATPTPVAAAPVITATPTATDTDRSLAFTGAEHVWPLTGLALALAGTGGVIVLAARRRQVASTKR